MCGLLFAISAEMNKRCSPSSERMLAGILKPLAITSATAVLSKQVVLLRVSQHEAVVRN